jgi:hypothetical protein
MRRIPAVAALAGMLVVAAATPAVASPTRSVPIHPAHLDHPTPWGEWIDD